MAWTVKTIKNNFMVAYEDLVLSTTPGTNDISTSRFTDDMLVPGKNFLVGLYARNASSSGAVDVDVDGSWAADGTYAVIKADVIASVTLGAETAWGNYPIATNGELPYMKVRIDPDTAGKATQTYRVYVVQDNQAIAT
jgi:hypothetical protein